MHPSNGGMASRAVKGNPVEPVPEEAEGTVFPYRGVENHGVKPDSKPPEYLDDQWPEDDQEEFYTPGPTEDDPIPVRLVQNDPKHVRRAWQPLRILVGGSEPVRIINRRDGRIGLLLRSRGSNSATVWLGDSPDKANTTLGYGLATGAEMPAMFVTTEEVWGYSENGNVQDLFGLEIYELDV